MPTLSNLNLPKPKSWEEFEEISLDALKLKWDNPDLNRHGRQGQSQHGVDIYGENYFFEFTGVQCKKYDLKLTRNTVEEEIKNAEEFEPKIEKFFIATTAPTDAQLQKEIRLISKDRKAQGKFPVGIFFWNDIVQELVANEKIFQKHYPQISLNAFNAKASKRLFSLSDLVFHGMSLKHYTDVLYGDFGQLANEDPRKIEVIASIIESASLAVCSEQERAKINDQLNIFMGYILPAVTGTADYEFHWKISDDNAERVSGVIKTLEHSLVDEELVVFKIGELFSIWNQFEFEKEESEPISSEFMSNLIDLISKLNSGKVPERIEQLIDSYQEYHNDTSYATIVDKVYFQFKKTLIEQEMI